MQHIFFSNKIEKLIVIFLEIDKTVLKRKNGFGDAGGVLALPGIKNYCKPL